MKKIFFLSLSAILLIVSLASCKKIKDALFPSFDTTTNTLQITIPAVNVTFIEAQVGGVAIYFNMDSVIRAKTVNQFTINNVTSIKMKQINVDLQNTDQNNNLANFLYARVNFYSNANTTPVQITNTNIADSTAAALVIPIADSPELKDYFKGNQLYYVIFSKLRRGLSKSLTANITATFHVE